MSDCVGNALDCNVKGSGVAVCQKERYTKGRGINYRLWFESRLFSEHGAVPIFSLAFLVSEEVMKKKFECGKLGLASCGPDVYISD